jgi:hypothetical protein
MRRPRSMRARRPGERCAAIAETCSRQADEMRKDATGITHNVDDAMRRRPPIRRSFGQEFDKTRPRRLIGNWKDWTVRPGTQWRIPGLQSSPGRGRVPGLCRLIRRRKGRATRAWSQAGAASVRAQRRCFPRAQAQHADASSLSWIGTRAGTLTTERAYFNPGLDSGAAKRQADHGGRRGLLGLEPDGGRLPAASFARAGQRASFPKRRHKEGETSIGLPRPEAIAICLVPRGRAPS